jgi:K+-sensing histidine kinase KdpD
MRRQVVFQELISRKRYEIHPPCIVGRGGSADLAFPDPAISEQHALLLEIEGKLWIRDLESTNGVFVNDIKVVSEGPIRQSDCIQLGKTRFLVLECDQVIPSQTMILHTLDPSDEGGLDRKRLKLILEMATELSENQEMDALHENLLPKFKEVFKQDRGCIALFQEDGSLKPLFADPSLASVPLSRSVIRRLFQGGESFLLEDALSDASLKEQESVLGLSIRSALCAPLIYRNQIYGLIYLDRNVPGAYNQDDLELLKTIALITAPLIENARLLCELRELNAGTIKALKETEARLLDRERTAAYSRLAQAMAHEIRNPLVAIGGLVRRIVRHGSESENSAKFQAVVSSVERIEMVLKEVDRFVRFPVPDKKLARIDQAIREELARHHLELQNKGIRSMVSVHATHVMIPVDFELFREAVSLIIKEILPSLSQGSELRITLEDLSNELAIHFGEISGAMLMCDLLSPDLERTPWSLGLFLNLAYKIISDHGGKLLANPRGHSPFPLLVKMPRTILRD